MDDTPANENPQKDFNKLDLSQLQGFSFGTQWTQDKTSSPDQRDRADRPRRESSPERREGGAPERRDRRAFRKPAGGESGGGSSPASAPAGGAGETQPRREYSNDRGPRREYQGGQRHENAGGGERGGPRYGGYGARPEAPYDSPYFHVAFYPEDTSFNALAKTIRSSCRTIELFEIARTVIGKSDRFVVVLGRRSPSSMDTGRPAPGAGDAGATSAPPPARQPIYLSVPDGLPFETEEAAIAHVLTNHLGRFFDLAEVEVEPPKGNFQVINRCGVTGELLGPPNYHRYAQIVQQHFAAKISRMSFEAFRGRIETVRDPEVVAQWLEKMKKTTRYTWKQSGKSLAGTSAPTPTVAAEPASPVTAEAVAEVAAQEGSTTPETAPALTFDNFEDARSHLVTQARDKVVRPVETARLHGKLVETMPAGEIRRAIEGALERQRRFPLDTANALRGRLRREHFTIFKKGSKGVSYVCAVKRKFRVPGQTFAESISALIAFIEARPMIRASELPKKFLGIDIPSAPKTPETAPATAGSATADAGSATPEVPTEASSAPAPSSTGQETSASPVKTEPVLTIEQRAKINRMQGDLRWLVTEGYVTEFIDGRLFAPPPVVEARKKEVELEEHDPENFPDIPPSDSRPPIALATQESPGAGDVLESAPRPTPAANDVAVPPNGTTTAATEFPAPLASTEDKVEPAAKIDAERAEPPAAG